MNVTIKKRFIAMLCMICLLCQTCFCTISASAQNGGAQEDITVDSLLNEEGYTYWTLSDVDIADETFVAAAASYRELTRGDFGYADMNKVIFSMKMEFPRGGNVSVEFGNVGNSRRFRLNSRGDGIQFRYLDTLTGTPLNQVLNSTDAKVELLDNKGLEIAISVEYGSRYVVNNVSYVDMKVGIFFNGKLYNNTYFTVQKVQQNGLNENSKKLVLFGDSGGTGTTIASNHLKENTNTDVTSLQAQGYDYWSLPEVNINDQTFAQTGLSNKLVASGSRGNNPLNKTIFTAKMEFPKAGRSGIEFGYDGNARFRLESRTGYLQFRYIDGPAMLEKQFYSSVAKVALQGTKDLAVAISVEYGDVYTEANVDYVDMKVGVFFNGKLYNNEYFTVQKVPAAHMYGKNVFVYDFNGTGFSLASNALWDRPLDIEQRINEGYSYWTLSDVNIADQTFAAGTTGEVTRGNRGNVSMDKTIYTSKIEFPASGKAAIEFGSVADGNRFRLENVGETLLLRYMQGGNQLLGQYMYSDKADIKLTDNKELAVAVLVEAGEEYTVGEIKYVDLRVGVYFNGNLYNNQYFTAKKVPVSSMIAKYLMIYNPGGTEFSVASNHLLADDRTDVMTLKDKGYDYWTLSDMGITDQTVSETTKDITEYKKAGSLHKTIFTAQLEYPKKDFAAYEFGDGGEYRFRIQSSGSDIRIRYLDGSNGTKWDSYFNSGVAKVALRANKTLTTSISVEFIKEYTEDKVDYVDMKVGVFFNGRLYNNEYYTIEKVTKSKVVSRYVMIGNGSQNTFSVASNYLWDKIQSGYQKGMTELTASDFGLNGVKVSNADKNAVYDEQTFDNTAVMMMMNFPSGSSNSMYLGGNDTGIRLRAGKSGKIALSYVDNETVKSIATLNPDKVGVESLTDETLKWQFVFLMSDTESDTTRLSLGVYVDGKLYGGEYFLLNDVDAECLKRIIGIHAPNGTFDISNQVYEELTFYDFSVLNTRVDKPEKAYANQNYCDYASLNGSAFTGIVNFPEKGSASFRLGGKLFNRGITVSSLDNGCIRVSHVNLDGGTSIIADMSPESLGEDTLKGKDVEIRLTFDVMENSKEDADVRISIYVNGKLHNGKYYLLQGVHTDTINRTMKIYVVAGVGPFEIKSVEKPVDLSIYGFDYNWRKTLGL